MELSESLPVWRHFGQDFLYITDVGLRNLPPLSCIGKFPQGIDEVSRLQ
jgi:hypothetical protein